MINDISGGGNKFINIDMAKEYNVPICLMHMKGIPKNMQKRPSYKNIIEEIKFFFSERLEYALKIGLKESKIILDPGIGFGKTVEDNYKIISNIAVFKSLGFKLLIGLSRKSFLKYNNNLPKDRLLSSIALQAICVSKGVDIIRTHDVDETYDSLTFINKLEI
jgi:dihydropteroate synthase